MLCDIGAFPSISVMTLNNGSVPGVQEVHGLDASGRAKRMRLNDCVYPAFCLFLGTTVWVRLSLSGFSSIRPGVGRGRYFVMLRLIVLCGRSKNPGVIRVVRDIRELMANLLWMFALP